MKTISFALLTLLLFHMSCKHPDELEVDKIADPILIPSTATTILLETKNSTDQKIIPVYVALPQNRSERLKGMVVLHGSGGPWDDDDLDGDGIAEVCNVGTPSKQTREWRDLLTANGLLAAFPDSYSPRMTCENEGSYKEPPLKFTISGTFIRNGDAYATLALLKRLVWKETNQPVLDATDVGILGFSDGGTSVISTLYDSNATPPNWTWKQTFNNVTYTSEVLPPGKQPGSDGFKFGVLYYPGSYHNGYYGNLCNGSGIYKSYADLLLHIASDDPLTDNTKCLVETMLQNGGGAPTVFEYEGADHGFDGETADFSNLARTRTLAFIAQKMAHN